MPVAARHGSLAADERHAAPAAGLMACPHCSISGADRDAWDQFGDLTGPQAGLMLAEMMAHLAADLAAPPDALELLCDIARRRLALLLAERR